MSDLYDPSNRDTTIADLQSQLEAARKKLEKLKPNREDFRLSEADLHRIVNECGSANDLSDCVKDLLLAHYMYGDLREQLEAAKKVETHLRETMAAALKCSVPKELYEAAKRENDVQFLRLKDADWLADEVAAMIQLRAIDSRSRAGDALLDYRQNPRSERSDKLADLQQQLATLTAENARLHKSTANQAHRNLALEKECSRLNASLAEVTRQLSECKEKSNG